MKKVSVNLIFALIAILIISCTSKVKQQGKITTLEKELFDSNSTSLDTTKANKLLNLYEEYAKNNANDTLSAGYLFKAADLCMNTNKGSKAVELFSKIIATYTNFEKLADCYFLMAFTYENVLKDNKNADKFYNEFINKFPTHKLVDDAKFSVMNLGKTPEQLVAEFEAKQLQQDSINKIATKK